MTRELKKTGFELLKVTVKCVLFKDNQIVGQYCELIPFSYKV